MYKSDMLSILVIKLKEKKEKEKDRKKKRHAANVRNWQKNNPLKVSATGKKYYYNNRVKCINMSIRYNLNNKIKVGETRNKYREKYKEKIKKYQTEVNRKDISNITDLYISQQLKLGIETIRQFHELAEAKRMQIKIKRLANPKNQTL